MAPIYMTAVLQYTINEVLEGAGVLVRLLREDMKITPQILRLVIANDSELKEVFKGGILPSSGGGSYVSKKHLHQVRGTYETTDDEEEEVEVLRGAKIRGRKGGTKPSRARKGKGRDEEEDSDDSAVEETRGSTRGIKDRNRVRRKDKKRNSRSPEHVPVVDSETFAQCKELMRPVQKKIIEFGSDTDPRKSSEVQLLESERYLVDIGNHIESLVVNKSNEEIGYWRFNLWFYVSNFNPLSNKDLYHMYQVLKDGVSGSESCN